MFRKIQFSISIVFCLHSVKCQNSSLLNNSASPKYSFNVKKTFYFKQFSLAYKNIPISSNSV